MITRFVIAIMSAFGAAGQTLATEISGDIWGELHADNNPYTVTGDLRVPTDSSLHIFAGCRFEFRGHYMIFVDTSATLVANGIQSDSVIFAPIDTTEGWFGIRSFRADSISLSYCRLEYSSADDETGPRDEEWARNGGAVCCIESRLYLSHCNLQYNWVPAGSGGAIYCREANVSLHSNIINNNLAMDGGGIAVEMSQFQLSGNIIRGNLAYYQLGGELGGGIICGNEGSLIGNVIDSNLSSGHAGGILTYGDIFVIDNIVNYNSAYSVGGIFMWEGNIVLTGNVIACNITEFFLERIGGGICTGFSHVVMTNNVIYGNQASHAAALFIGDNDIPDTILNCVFWSNSSDTDSNIYYGGAAPSISYCDVQDGWPGEGNIDANPLFCDTAQANFWLAANSPCVGAGYGGVDIGAYGVGCEAQDVFEDIIAPGKLAILFNYPNPFNAQTTIRFSLPKAGPVALDIYDILGRRMGVAFSGMMPAGENRILWDGAELPSGAYFYRVTADGAIKTGKMTLVK